MKSQGISQARTKVNERPIQPVDPHLVRYLFIRWEPERPELLVRVRPRLPKESHVAQ